MTIGHEFSMPPLLSGLDYMARATHHIIIITTISSGNVLPLELYFSFCLEPAPVVPGPPKRKGKKKRVSSSFKIKILFLFCQTMDFFPLVGKAKGNNKTTR
jgi:hypothetical protein